MEVLRLVQSRTLFVVVLVIRVLTTRWRCHSCSVLVIFSGSGSVTHTEGSPSFSSVEQSNWTILRVSSLMFAGEIMSFSEFLVFFCFQGWSLFRLSAAAMAARTEPLPAMQLLTNAHPDLLTFRNPG